MKIFDRKILTYIVVSFVFSWSIALILWKAEGLDKIIKFVFTFGFMCGPGLAGLVCAWRFNKGDRVKALGLSGPWTKWFLWAWLIGMMLILGSTALHLLSPSVGLVMPAEGYAKLLAEAGQGEAVKILETMPHINLILIAQFAVLAPLLNIPLMLSEELGWRGWLWHELRPSGFWVASFWIGLIWGLWHLPLIAMGQNYLGMSIWGPVLFTIFCILYSPIFSLVRERSQSVWGPCVLHATTNGAAALGFALQSNTDMPWRGLVGIGGFVMMGIILLWVYKQMPPVKKAVTVSA